MLQLTTRSTMAGRFAVLLALASCCGCWANVAHQLRKTMGHTQQPLADCSFKVPATNAPGYCETFDLTGLPQLNFTVAGRYNMTYSLSVCEALTPSNVPAMCSSSQTGGTAYQFSTQTRCHLLGLFNSSFVFPLDPTNSSAGIRVAYNHGEMATNWPRAIIYDFPCDPNAGVGKPISLIEFPAYTYKVHWPTALACPGPRVEGSCPLPTFDGTWGTVRFRTRPSWYDDVKFGIFLHWGVFSVPAFIAATYWERLLSGEEAFVLFHNRVYGCSGVKPEKYPCNGPNFTYPEFAPNFKAELFDPDAWATLFKQAGAKYVVLVSKHHDGWCNFKNSYHWNWNSIDLGPKRDLVGDLTDSVRAAGLHMGLYHSLREWYHPLYLKDNADNCSTTDFPDQVLIPTMKEMVNQYKPEVIWADGAGDSPCTHDSVHYWKAPEFLSWLYNDSPVKDTVVANSRWGEPRIGDFQTGNDRYSPGFLIPYKWESCYTVQQHAWGFDRTEGIENFWNTTHLVRQLVSSVSCNGNLLLNVGPTADGRIIPAFEERLLQMGAWLEVNGEAIYSSRPWRAQNDTATQQTWYTTSKNGTFVYAITFETLTPGTDVILKQPKTTPSTEIYLLGFTGGPLSFSAASDGVHIKLPDVMFDALKYAWTFKMMGVE